MTGLLARAASLVVEPQAPIDAGPAVPSDAARALVLGGPAAAAPVAAALAGTLRSREGAPAALLCVWAPAAVAGERVPPDPAPSVSPVGAGPAARTSPAAAGPAPSGWASAGARRLTARLAARELPVRAAGRLAWLPLPAAPAEAAQVLGRLLGWLDAPVVTALAGPRSPELDALISAHDLVIAVRPPADPAVSPASRETLAQLALADLDPEAVRAVVCDPLAPGLARWRAKAGLGRLPAGHPALDALGPRRTKRPDDRVSLHARGAA